MRDIDTISDFIDAHEELISQIPTITSIYPLDFSVLYNHNLDLADKLLKEPDEIIQSFISAVRSKIRARGREAPNLRVEVVALLETMPIRQLNHSQIGQLVQVEGIITQTSKPEQVIVRGIYECLGCGAEHVVDQKTPFTQMPPKCDCGKSNFSLIPEKSVFTERQYIAIQEAIDQVPSGKLPRDFPCELSEGLVDIAPAGTRVTVVGKVYGRRRKKNDPDPVIDLYLDVNSIGSREQDYTDIVVTEEDRRIFVEMSKHEDHLGRVTSSVAPTIHGCDEVKLAMALQLCEGVTKIIHKKRRRGEIHLLLTGNPGEAKSVLCEQQVSLHPRGIQTTGRGSTAVGLTASVVQEDGRWVLKAGAMVLADRGLLVADEFTRMDNTDREMLHPAMSRGNISINKAGINVVLSTRTSVLAACNPVGGQWNPHKTIIENLKKLPTPLINRFDLIFVMAGDRTVEEEMERAEFVADLFTAPEESTPPIDFDTLRKFFIYARSFKPRITKPARGRITKYYKRMVQAGMAAQSIRITLRQLEGTFRLAEASAKLHLRDEVLVEDADVAISLVDKSLRQAGLDPATGEIDAEMLVTGIPSSLRKKLRRLVDVVAGFSESNIEGRWVSEEVLMEYLRDTWKMQHFDAVDLLEAASREGMIWKDVLGRWKAS